MTSETTTPQESPEITLKDKVHNEPNRRPASPCVMVIFGAAGDLTKRLLFPAICNLGSAGLLDENFSIIGIAREDYTDESFREKMKENAEKFVKNEDSKQYVDQVIKRLFYIRGDFSNADVYEILKKRLKELEPQKVSSNCIFYFAAPPKFMKTIAENLNTAKLVNEEEAKAFRRIVVEKPFGHDLASARELDKLLLSIAKETQVFRIDHFLGKETVQNILAFRFSNGFFEPLWNRLHIDHVQITVSEELGVEQRGNYYETSGAMRDMVPNHLFQLLALITMEPPASFAGSNIHMEKAKALRSVERLTKETLSKQVVRGQYDAGTMKDGSNVQPYRSEKNVDPNSNIETFVALKLFVNNWRWLHVPFYIRTGKRMPTRHSEIIIQFKSGPAALFDRREKEVGPNSIRIYIQPHEGIALQFNAKVPGPILKLEEVEMKFKYEDYFKKNLQTGYEMILYDCMNGEQILFADARTIEAGWAIVQPILEDWASAEKTDFPNYKANSWGPKAADELIEKDGREWQLD